MFTVASVEFGPILGELEPGRDVRVVVEPGAHDLVPALERPAERACEQEVE